MHHPLERIPSSGRKIIFWLLFLATLILLVIFNTTGAPLNTQPAPYGVVSYELAGNVSQAQAILSSWDQKARLVASFGLGLDYLFMPVYATTIGLGCIWAAEVLCRRKWPMDSIGAPLAWLLWLGAVLDGIENIALTVMLFNLPVNPWPEIARWCATGKFTFIFLGLVYSFLGLAAHLVGRLSPD
jgi:hypothetical protein